MRRCGRRREDVCEMRKARESISWGHESKQRLLEVCWADTGSCQELWLGAEVWEGERQVSE